MKTIGFAGTAKNTGKTNTTLAVIKQAHAAGLQLAMAGSGFDSETHESAKPKHMLDSGDMVATAAACLNTGSATFEILESTNIDTTFGKVTIARVISPGTVEVTGSNREKDLATLIEIFQNHNVDLLLVDGAFNRLVPLIACDGLVLSTGAAFDSDIHKLADHAGMMIKLFTPPVTTAPVISEQNTTLVFEDQSSVELNTGSMLSGRTMDDILSLISKPLKSLEIPGTCHPMLLKTLIEKNPYTDKPLDLILANPLKLITSTHPALWLELLLQPLLSVYYRHHIPVKILSVNPYYQKFNPVKNALQAAFVDKYFLLRTVRIALPNFPVYDLNQPPQPDLLRLLGIGNTVLLQ